MLEAAPRGVSRSQVTKSIEGVAGVCGVHHVHVWSIDSDSMAASAHVRLDEDSTVAESQEIVANIKSLLAEDLAIAHVTIEVEASGCRDPA